MKIYTNEFNLNERSDKAIWVAPQSDYKVGVKVTKDGSDVAMSSISVYEGSTLLSADETAVNGFKVYTRKSANPSTNVLDVKIDGEKKAAIKVNTTDSTVYDVDEKGNSETYTLPKASASTLGGVKIGTGISIDSDGKISAQSSGMNIKVVSHYTVPDTVREGDFLYFLPSDEITSSDEISYDGHFYTSQDCKLLAGVIYKVVLIEEHYEPEQFEHWWNFYIEGGLAADANNVIQCSLIRFTAYS